MASKARKIANRAKGNNKDENTGPDREDRESGIAPPGDMPVRKMVKQYRQEQKAAGVRGPQLREAVEKYRDDTRAAENEAMRQSLPGNIGEWVKNPRKFLNKGGARRRRLLQMGAMEDINREKYGQEQREQLADHYRQNLPTEAGAPADIQYRHETAPTWNRLQGYVNSRFDWGGDLRGLSRNEEAMYRGNMRDAVESGHTQAAQNEMSRAAAAGIDPRSGVAANRAMQLQAQRQQALTGVERELSDMNLQRKRDYEGMLSSMAGAEEGRRQYDVRAGYDRLGQVEEGLGGLYGVGERTRQYDLDLIEGQHQSRLARAAMERAGRALEPSTLEKVGAGIGGVASGI